MAPPDLEVFKDIPGYQAILKAVLKNQIQYLVEQLADQAGEESVLLTASVSEGTLCHLGSTSGRFFLEGHEDFKSKFLGFCLKRHHKQHEELEVKTAPVPAYVMKCPKKLPSHKGQWSATHKPYQRRHVTPKFTKPRVQLRAPKVHLHTEHEFQPNINGDNMEENLVLQSDATGIPSVTNSVHSDQTVNFNTSHSDEPNSLSRMEFEGGHIEFEGSLPTSTDNSSHSEAPKGSYTEADTAVECAEESYREVVRIKQEPQTDNDDEQEVANMVYSVGAEGSQMAAPNWDTNIAGLGPEFDTGSLAGQEADNPQLSNMSYAGYQFSGGGRKVRQYPKSAMKAALDAVRSGVMRKSQAAMYFGGGECSMPLAVSRRTCRRRYTQSAMEAAVRSVVDGELSTLKAASTFGVPRSTLQDLLIRAYRFAPRGSKRIDAPSNKHL